MNLKQTIEELEEQASQYTQAANTLRALQDGGTNRTLSHQKPGRQIVPQKSAPKNLAVKQRAGKPGKKKVSPETRAKISAALKARYEEKKKAAS